MARHVRLLVLLVALAVIGAACGDSGDESGSDDGSGSDATPAATAPAATAPANTADSDDTLGTLGTLLGNVPGLDDECVAIANVFGTLTQVSMVLGGQVDFDAGEAQALFDEAADQLPGDLQDDLQVMADGLIAFFQAVSNAGVDFSAPESLPSAAQLAELEAASDAIDTDEFNEASDNLTAYADEVCPDS